MDSLLVSLLPSPSSDGPPLSGLCDVRGQLRRSSFNVRLARKSEVGKLAGCPRA